MRSSGPELFADWRDMVHALLQANVDFLVVGAFAVATHGHSRATKDIDFLVRPSAANAARVMQALRQFGAPLHGATLSDFARPGTILQLGVPPRRIDLLTAIEGVSYEDAAADSLHVKVGGLSVPVIGRRMLLRNKRAAGRLQDLADIEALEGIETPIRATKGDRTRRRRRQTSKK